jgi:hypothetical protein
LEPPLVGSSSHGIGVPAADVPASRPLRGAGSEEPASFGPASPGADRVPSSWFCTTSTVFSEWQLRVCCTPLPVKGSPRFVCAGLEVARRRPAWPGTVLAARFGPFEEFPSSAAGNASLRPLPSCRYRPARRSRRPKPAVVPTAIPAGAGGVHRGDSPGGGAPCPEGRGGRSRRERRLRAPKSGGPGSLGGRGRRLRRVGRPGPAGGGVAPRSGVALPCRGGDALPCREEFALFRRAGVAEPGGTGGRGSEESRQPCPGDREAGLRRAPGPSPEEAGPTLRRATSLPPWRGSAPFGSRGPRGVPMAVWGSEELRRPPGGPGVRARRLGRCARKRSRCGDAPIRLRGPPHHRARGVRRSKLQRGHVIIALWCRCRSADVTGGNRATSRS